MNRIILISVLSILTLNGMAQEKIIQTAGRDQLGEFAPKFAELNDDILFGEVWSRNDLLNLRDRSLVTITSLISQGITDSSLGFHLQPPKSSLTSRFMQDGLKHGRHSAWLKRYGRKIRQTTMRKQSSSAKCSFPSANRTRHMPNISSATVTSPVSHRNKFP